jgi:hypothetical protein
MSDYSFQLWSGVFLLVLVILAFLVGIAVKRNPLWILVDSRGRYSLTHFQIVLWTVVILSSILGVLISRGFAKDFQIPPQLLGLMGISAGSAVLATAVKGSKDAPGSQARIARAATGLKLAGGGTKTVEAHFSQIWLEEEGDQADQVISITKYQNFIFTLVILGIYVSMAWKSGGLPVLPDNVVWLVAISHGGYVGGKVPGKQ